MKTAFVGFGELGRQISAMLDVAKPGVDRHIFDDDAHATHLPEAHPFADFASPEFAAYAFYVCLGYKHLARKSDIIRNLVQLGRNVPSLVHPTCFVNPTSRIGRGAFLYPMCNVDKQSVIADGVLLNNSVTVSHDNVIGEGSYLSPGVVTSGFVRIGRNSFVGSGAVISNGVSIGDDCLIGIGTVVTSDVAPGSSVIGNPARLLKHRLALS